MTIRTILVVDDEAHIRHVVSLKLQNAGFNVITASDGEEGFEVATQERPDLIITDLQMPYMTGVEMCAKLHAQKATRDIPAFLLTARGYALDGEDLRRTSIKGMLSKPFSPREVLETIKQALGPDEAPPTQGATEAA